MTSVASNTPEMFLYNFLMLLLYLLIETSYLSDQTQISFRDSANCPVIEQCPRLQFTAQSPRQEMFLQSVVAAPPAYGICRT